jgi:hypothetical protein
MKLISINYLLSKHIQNVLFEYVANIKIFSHFVFLFIFEVQSAFDIYSTSQFELVIFKLLHIHMQLLATMTDKKNLHSYFYGDSF